ncbi:hypothetical protein amb3528 [Paramagnetospirillum magneticum AMB-1]|uniref:Uncharacterized protein n=1 Tax=Paramagnetospirillum magneticum (strain ATCC 700264 / AMB-1) TaxID=342108 RepID=Q2W1E3_PARM1|nr:hypothetical protein amb3528 [Paramagnetospirillum magneticum AMB-1]
MGRRHGAAPRLGNGAAQGRGRGVDHSAFLALFFGFFSASALGSAQGLMSAGRPTVSPARATNCGPLALIALSNSGALISQ